MKVVPLKLPGAYLIESQIKADNRGYFSRAFCEDTFKQHGLETKFPQSSISFNHKCGTLRGLHFQTDPYWEVKLVRAVAGRVWDVMVDLRPDSPTFKQHLAVELDADKQNAVYIPKGFAHGFQSLTDGATLLYYCSERFNAAAVAGYRFDDPAFSIPWPIIDGITISDADRALPLCGF